VPDQLADAKIFEKVTGSGLHHGLLKAFRVNEGTIKRAGRMGQGARKTTR
jgi:hypothetical protein